VVGVGSTKMRLVLMHRSEFSAARDGIGIFIVVAVPEINQTICGFCLFLCVVRLSPFLWAHNSHKEMMSLCSVLIFFCATYHSCGWAFGPSANDGCAKVNSNR
jgi:hypothetical protein